MAKFQLATFEVDISPPLGHPLCGGWIEPARKIVDPLKALGVILFGAEKPIVLCAFDWVGLRNDANLHVREAIAAGAGTTADQVSVHCVHPHDAPFADVAAQQMLAKAGAGPCLDLRFFEQVLDRLTKATKLALEQVVPFTHVGVGQATVNQVASSRRIVKDGKAIFSRTSSTKNEVVRAYPEGLIDPNLRTLSLWDNETPLACLHFYATHPMSYYGAGQVSCDFCGLAREKMQQRYPKTRQIYFTGCAGNITAGKYNDGAPTNRPILMDRMFQGMKSAFDNSRKMAVKSLNWHVEKMQLKPRTEVQFGEESSSTVLQDRKQSPARRGNAAFQIAWLKRLDRPVLAGCLHVNEDTKVLCLPGEAFIEYQLKAHQMAGKEPLFVAAYGDGGMGYIPTANAFLEGGYEPTVALAHPDTETILLKTIKTLLGKDQQ
ncbi:MAG: hypothetical protein R3B84_14210 [Zavarzinella sp.]